MITLLCFAFPMHACTINNYNILDNTSMNMHMHVILCFHYGCMSKCFKTSYIAVAYI